MGVTAFIVFLAVDYFPPDQKPVLSSSNPGKLQIKEEGSHQEGSHMEGSHRDGEEKPNLSQEEREHRMGVFHYNEGNKFYKEGNFAEAIIRYKKAFHHNKGFKQAIINLSTAYMKNKKLFLLHYTIYLLFAISNVHYKLLIIVINNSCYGHSICRV